MGLVHTHIESTHKGQLAVNDKQLLVVSPVEDHVARSAVDSLEGFAGYLGQVEGVQVAERISQLLVQVIASGQMIWVSEDVDVGVKALESLSGVLQAPFCLVSPCYYFSLLNRHQTYPRVEGEGGLNFLVNDDVNLDTTLGGSLEHVVKAVFLILGRRTTEVQLRAQPPVQNKDALTSLCGSKCVRLPESCFLPYMTLMW